MLKSIVIKKLFDRFNYKLDFSSKGIMIITGPNGYGKSTILRIIDSFCNESFQKLLDYPFESLTLIGENNRVNIKKDPSSFSINTIKLQNLNILWEKEQKTISYLKRFSFEEYIDLNFSNRTYNNTNESPSSLTGDNTIDIFFTSYLLLCQNEVKKDKEIYNKVISAAKTIYNIKQEIGRVRFIQEQRLIEKRIISDDQRSTNRQKEKYVYVIEDNSERLKEELSEIMRRHSALSSQLDSTYLKRLFGSDSNIKDSYEQVKNSLTLLNEKQEKLQKYGLAENQNVSQMIDLDENKYERFSAELSIFIEDTNRKYRVFESIINKLDLYEKIVNQKLTFKRMILSSSQGITIISDENKILSLNELSSGEQEILVLFYKLIFESDVSLLLVDEPEISLHIAWQKEIMDNLKSIVQLNNNLQMIIATHSPQIISNNWDLQIDLGGQYNG